MHKNAPLTPQGRRRLAARCRTQPIAHVAAEMGISRATASKWVNRYRLRGAIGLIDRPSTPHRQHTATDPKVVIRIEAMRRTHKWSASRIAFELQADGITISRRTVTRRLASLALNHRRFLDPNGESNREPRKIIARRPGHMVHLDVKKVGRIPDGGGWRPTAAEPTRPKRRNSPRGRPGGAATSICTPPSTGIRALPIPKRSLTRRPSPRSRSCTVPALGSPRTGSPGSSASSPTTGLATELKRSHGRCLGPAISGSPRTRLATMGRWRGTTGSSPRSSSAPARGPQMTSDVQLSQSGTSTTTSTGPTAPLTVNPRRHCLGLASATSWSPIPSLRSP